MSKLISDDVISPFGKMEGTEVCIKKCWDKGQALPLFSERGTIFVCRGVELLSEESSDADMWWH